MTAAVPPGVRDALLDGLLRWLASATRWFDPPQEDAPCGEAPEDVLPGPRRKAFGELGLALALARRSPALRRHPVVRQLTSVWVRRLDERRVFFDLERRVVLFPLRVVAYATLRELGREDEAVVAGLQRVLDGGFVDRGERSAWDQLDLAYYLDVAGLRHALPGRDELLARSSLFAPPALPHATRLDLYAITHLVFGFTGFGRDPAAVAGVAGLRDYAAAALARCLAAEDWDLVAELMAARICARLDGDGLDRACACALADVQDPSGFLPGQAWTAGTRGGPLDEEVFLDVYHPTLVGLILLACDGARA